MKLAWLTGIYLSFPRPAALEAFLGGGGKVAFVISEAGDVAVFTL